MSLRSPEEMPHAFARAWMERDAAALASLFSSDADFVNVVGIWWDTRAAIEAAHRYGLMRFFARSQLSPGRVKTRMLGADAAVVHVRFRLSGQTTRDGGEAGLRNTVMTFVMQRDMDGWHCVAAQNTDTVPGAETLEATGKGLVPRDGRHSD